MHVNHQACHSIHLTKKWMPNIERKHEGIHFVTLLCVGVGVGVGVRDGGRGYWPFE
jgi:hypothetical protein